MRLFGEKSQARCCFPARFSLIFGQFQRRFGIFQHVSNRCCGREAHLRRGVRDGGRRCEDACFGCTRSNVRGVSATLKSASFGSVVAEAENIPLLVHGRRGRKDPRKPARFSARRAWRVLEVSRTARKPYLRGTRPPRARGLMGASSRPSARVWGQKLGQPKEAHEIK